MVLRALHLCSGYGGFELAIRLAGVPARTVAHVERDAFAAATLVARMEEAHLDRAPVWSDLTTFDGAAWRGRVGLVTAGFPCQPFSAAGQQRGTDDDRWLWPAIGRLIGDVGPRLVFLENVPGLVRAGLPHVLADLADLGFDAEWGLYSAAEAGAPHRRERFWLLARADEHGQQSVGRVESGHERDAHGCGGSHVGHAGGPGRPEDAGGPSGDARTARRWTDGDHVADGAGQGLADATGDGRVHAGPDRPGDGGNDAGHGHRPGGGCAGVAAPASEGLQGPDGIEPAYAEPAGPDRVWPPGRDDADGWRHYIAAGGPEPSVRRGTDGRPAGLADALHLGGNGLVPVVAARALVELADRLGVDLWEGLT